MRDPQVLDVIAIKIETESCIGILLSKSLHDEAWVTLARPRQNGQFLKADDKYYWRIAYSYRGTGCGLVYLPGEKLLDCDKLGNVKQLVPNFLYTTKPEEFPRDYWTEDLLIDVLKSKRKQERMRIDIIQEQAGTIAELKKKLEELQK